MGIFWGVCGGRLVVGVSFIFYGEATWRSMTHCWGRGLPVCGGLPSLLFFPPDHIVHLPPKSHVRTSGMQSVTSLRVEIVGQPTSFFRTLTNVLGSALK